MDAVAVCLVDLFNHFDCFVLFALAEQELRRLPAEEHAQTDDREGQEHEAETEYDPPSPVSFVICIRGFERRHQETHEQRSQLAKLLHDAVSGGSRGEQCKGHVLFDKTIECDVDDAVAHSGD